MCPGFPIIPKFHLLVGPLICKSQEYSCTSRKVLASTNNIKDGNSQDRTEWQKYQNQVKWKISLYMSLFYSNCY